jgi:hypothetical protein
MLSLDFVNSLIKIKHSENTIFHTIAEYPSLWTQMSRKSLYLTKDGDAASLQKVVILESSIYWDNIRRTNGALQYQQFLRVP